MNVMAEKNNNNYEMWAMLATEGESWEHEPSAEILASNAFFNALMGSINSMVHIKSELALTESEREGIMMDLKRNMASLVWVTPMYENFLKTEASGSTEGG